MYVRCFEVNYNYKFYESYIWNINMYYIGEELLFFRVRILDFFYDFDFGCELWLNILILRMIVNR